MSNWRQRDSRTFEGGSGGNFRWKGLNHELSWNNMGGANVTKLDTKTTITEIWVKSLRNFHMTLKHWRLRVTTYWHSNSFFRSKKHLVRKTVQISQFSENFSPPKYNTRQAFQNLENPNSLGILYPNDMNVQIKSEIKTVKFHMNILSLICCKMKSLKNWRRLWALELLVNKVTQNDTFCHIKMSSVVTLTADNFDTWTWKLVLWKSKTELKPKIMLNNFKFFFEKERRWKSHDMDHGTSLKALI